MMINLIYNEIEKLVKKTSFKICFVILLLVAITFPILFKSFSYASNSFIYTKDDMEYYESKIIKDPLSNQDKLTNELDKVMINIIKFVIDDKKLNMQSEFNNEIIECYTRDLLTLKALDYIKYEGINYKEIEDFYSIEVSSYIDLDNSSLEEVKRTFNEKIKEDFEFINTKDYTLYLKKEIERLDGTLDDEVLKEKVKLYKKYIELNIKDSNDFRVNEGNKILENISLKENVLSESEYKKVYKNMSYDVYFKIVKEKNREIDNDIKRSWYSIENNINYNSDLKSNFEEQVVNNKVIIGIVTIIISGGIVASEFQKGTIRLLVIKPCKRWKILLSKFLAVVITGSFLFMVMNILSLITCGFMYGFSDYLVNYLDISNMGVKEINYFVYIIRISLIYLIPIIFVNLISFSLSTITHNTALSVGITIFLELSYSLLIVIFMECGISFIDFTFLPYLDYSQFLDKKVLFDNNLLYEKYYDINKANLVLLMWGFVIYFISNLVFVKRDIKN